LKPRLALVLGDPSGIGPELVAKLLADPEVIARAEILLIGDRPVFEMGQEIAGLSIPVQVISDIAQARFDQGRPAFLALSTIDPAEIVLGQASAAAGRAALESLKMALCLAREGRVGGICYASLNKHNLHLAGMSLASELDFFAQELGHHGLAGEVNVLGRLWTTRVTSHVPLGQVPALLTVPSVLAAIDLAHHTLTAAGFERPRVAVAGLNPHAGESGDCGREEIEVIGPAVDQARSQGIDAQGPFAADTVFLRARDGLFDAVVTMYHDQGQIAMKLLGFERGVTVAGGLEAPITTPAHGTAFDIAGQGRAEVSALREAFLLACRMIENRVRRETPE